MKRILLIPVLAVGIWVGFLVLTLAVLACIPGHSVSDPATGELVSSGWATAVILILPVVLTAGSLYKIVSRFDASEAAPPDFPDGPED